MPAGIVVFLPSYNFEELMYKHLDKSGIIAKISSKKCVFREPKLASQVLFFIYFATNSFYKVFTYEINSIGE